jgi:UDP-N-acetyl-D-mannosaminuronic acid dehydrogenase
MVNNIKVQVIGLGRIGLCLFALISDKIKNTIGIDINQKRLMDIASITIPDDEPELISTLKNVYRRNNPLLKDKYIYANVHIIAVNTMDENGNSSTTAIIDVIKELSSKLNREDLILVVSTIPVGLSRYIINIIDLDRPDLENKYHYAYSPERGNPGELMSDIKKNKRIIATNNTRAFIAAKNFLSIFINSSYIEATLEEGELSKITENAYRNLSIAFSNELSMIISKSRMDIHRLLALINSNQKINIPSPGVGVGGACVPIDSLRFLECVSNESILIKSSVTINESKINWCVDYIISKILLLNARGIAFPALAFFGLTYKPNISDLKNSIAEKIAITILRLNICKVILVDPNISSHKDYEICDIDSAIEGSDLLVFMIAHHEFRSISIPDNVEVIDFVGVTC